MVTGAATFGSTLSATTITASTQFTGPGTGLTGTAASLTAGLVSKSLTGSPNITVGTITSGLINGQTISSGEFHEDSCCKRRCNRCDF